MTGLIQQGKYTVTLIEGDGIGPEISQSVKDIFEAAKVKTPTIDALSTEGPDTKLHIGSY